MELLNKQPKTAIQEKPKECWKLSKTFTTPQSPISKSDEPHKIGSLYPESELSIEAVQWFKEMFHLHFSGFFETEEEEQLRAMGIIAIMKSEKWADKRLKDSMICAIKTPIYGKVLQSSHFLSFDKTYKWYPSAMWTNNKVWDKMKFRVTCVRHLHTNEVGFVEDEVLKNYPDLFVKNGLRSW